MIFLARTASTGSNVYRSLCAQDPFSLKENKHAMNEVTLTCALVAAISFKFGNNMRWRERGAVSLRCTGYRIDSVQVAKACPGSARYPQCGLVRYERSKLLTPMN